MGHHSIIQPEDLLLASFLISFGNHFPISIFKIKKSVILQIMLQKSFIYPTGDPPHAQNKAGVLWKKSLFKCRFKSNFQCFRKTNFRKRKIQSKIFKYWKNKCFSQPYFQKHFSSSSMPIQHPMKIISTQIIVYNNCCKQTKNRNLYK